MRVLMVGCAAGAGELGVCDSNDERWAAEALGATLRNYARENNASLVVLKDFPASYRSTLSVLSENGYARVPSMPMTRLALPFQNFDEYMQTLGYVSRKSLRRKFRKTERAAKIEMEVVNDISPHIDAIYPLYLQVHERSPMKFETLTKEFFGRISQTMPERARFFIWRQSDKIIAFSLCLVCGHTIYDECLGLDYDVALDLHLYFYTMRDVIRWAIDQRLLPLLQRSAQLRSEAASRPRARAARSLRASHAKLAQSNLRCGVEISRTDAARSDFEKVSKRRSALSSTRTGMSEPDWHNRST